MVWESFFIAAAALKTPTRNGYNAQGVNLTFCLLQVYTDYRPTPRVNPHPATLTLSFVTVRVNPNKKVEEWVGARNSTCWLSQIGLVLCLSCPGYIRRPTHSPRHTHTHTQTYTHANSTRRGLTCFVTVRVSARALLLGGVGGRVKGLTPLRLTQVSFSVSS